MFIFGLMRGPFYGHKYALLGLVLYGPLIYVVRKAKAKRQYTDEIYLPDINYGGIAKIKDDNYIREKGLEFANSQQNLNRI